MRAFLALLAGTVFQPAMAVTPQEILQKNTSAVVFLERKNANGDVLETGSGFIVSPDGFVVTVAHIDPEPTEKLWATIGEREGTEFPLLFRDSDPNADVALWQFPQSLTCRRSVTLSSDRLEVLDPVLAVGFPGNSGLTPSSLTVNNLNTNRGFAKTDGFLEPGNSGGPVFNQGGHVVAIVQGGGLPGTENNEIIPISLGLALVRKWNVAAGVDAENPPPASCYATCRAPEHGIEGWASEVRWRDQSGWLGGGNNQPDVCAALAAATQAKLGADKITITETREESKKDLFGRVEYMYYCEGLAKIGPVYKEQRSTACGLWD